ncbi:MAG: TonB-dependent receptor plug domain-containing protein [Rudaea sp.]
MKQRLLVSSIIMGLCTSLAATAVSAQSADDQSDASQQKKKQTLETVVVTGSLIPQAQIETASPTITISADELSKQGFATAYDALKALPIANGSVQGNQSSGGFTQGAQTISLFGLPVNYTLFLINGKQMTNYPLAYNGSNAFTDLASIPVAMIDHIDIVPGGNSAIYGSAAIAGVVNIVLKEKYQGVDLDYRVGGYSDGGGQNQRLQLSGGGTWGNLDAAFALELINQEPIFAAQRSTTDSLNDNPTLNGKPAVPSRSFLILNGFTGRYIDPGAAACTPLSNLFGNTTAYDHRTPQGYYCGTTGQYKATSLLNENRSGTAYTNLVYHLDDHTEAYAQILFTSAAPKYNIGGSFQFWESNEQFLHPGTGYFWNPNAQILELWQHIVAPEEYGGSSGAGAETVYTRNLNAAIGLRGSLGNSDWNYDAYYNRSQANTDDSYRHFIKSAIDNYYLGPQMWTYYGYPVYTPNRSKLYQPLTPAIFDSLTARIDNKSVAWNQNINLTVNNSSLFHVPAGDVGFAATVQAGSDSLHNNIPAVIASGDALGLTGSQAAGDRTNYGIGAELRIPVVSMVTADVSGRYDDYRFAGNSAGKFTYKLGLEFRPMDNLLLRGNYATAFRAPDLVNVFGKNGFFTSDTDYYLCRLAGYGPTTYNNCPTVSQFFGYNGSSANLQDITAKTLTYGVVYSPIEKLTFKVDYQRVQIKNEVAQLSIDTLLQNEADCLLGQTVGGATIDPNSPSCKLYESLVQRSPADAKVGANGLISVTTYPVNAASESESGLIASADYALDIGRFGSLRLAGSYYIEFKHLYQQFPGDPIINVYHDPRYTDWKTTFNGSLTWNIGNWSTTLYGQRYGKIPNYAQTGNLSPWMLYNASVKYNFDSDAAIQLTSNNIFNSKPPVDKTASAFPYYNTYNYNPYGRAVWAEFAFHFGGKKG